MGEDFFALPGSSLVWLSDLVRFEDGSVSSLSSEGGADCWTLPKGKSTSHSLGLFTKAVAAVSVSSSRLGIRLSRAAMSEKLNRNEKIVLEHYPCMVFTDICEYVFFWKLRQQFNMNYSSVLATFAICYFYIYVCLYIVVVIAWLGMYLWSCSGGLKCWWRGPGLWPLGWSWTG